jgi:hypothetical protein
MRQHPDPKPPRSGGRQRSNADHRAGLTRSAAQGVSTIPFLLNLGTQYGTLAFPPHTVDELVVMRALQVCAQGSGQRADAERT